VKPCQIHNEYGDLGAHYLQGKVNAGQQWRRHRYQQQQKRQGKSQRTQHLAAIKPEHDSAQGHGEQQRRKGKPDLHYA